MLPELAAMQDDERAARRRGRRDAARARLGIDQPGTIPWAFCVALCGAALAWGVATPRGPIDELAVERVLLRGLAVVVCLGALWVWAHSIRTRRGEAAVSTAALAVVAGSALPLDRTASAAGTGWALVAVVPLVLGLSYPPLQRRWRGYSIATIFVGAGVAAAVALTGVSLPSGPHPLVWVSAGSLVGGAMVWSTRELRLYRIGRAPASLGAAIAVGVIGLASAAALLDEQAGGHLQPSVGLVVIAAGAAVMAISWAHRLPEAVRHLLEPIDHRWPLAVAELGLAPVVQRAAWRLELHDNDLRDHAVRTTELALRVGARLGLGSCRQRELAVAALLHDIGMLDVPEQVRGSSHSLDEPDRELMRRHPIEGAEMLAGVASLAEAARFIRAHHERVDGSGYPDRLAGSRVPLESRIIAVCDAYDALTRPNAHRAATGHEWAVGVLRQHAGAQWDAAVVEALIAVTTVEPTPSESVRSAIVELSSTTAHRSTTVDDAWMLFASDLLGEASHRQHDEDGQDHR